LSGYATIKPRVLNFEKGKIMILKMKWLGGLICLLGSLWLITLFFTVTIEGWEVSGTPPPSFWIDYPAWVKNLHEGIRTFWADVLPGRRIVGGWLVMLPLLFLSGWQILRKRFELRQVYLAVLLFLLFVFGNFWLISNSPFGYPYAEIFHTLVQSTGYMLLIAWLWVAGKSLER
jgi:hypothetical protein